MVAPTGARRAGRLTPRVWMLAPLAVAASMAGAGLVLVTRPSVRPRSSVIDEPRRTSRRPPPDEPVTSPQRPPDRVMPAEPSPVPAPVPSVSSAVPRPRGKVSLGGASVTGGTVSNASAVVAGMAAGFRACYNRGLATDPTMRGTVRLTALIGPAGEVLSASATGGGGLSGTVIGCVHARFASAQFAVPSGSPTITVPVTLEPVLGSSGTMP